MDDLWTPGSDRRWPADPSNPGTLGRGADRRRPRADLLLLALAACAASPGPRPPAEAAAPAAELWCDASALPGGDGSRERPLKALPPRVAPGVAVHARSGLYAGPVQLAPGASLTGHGVVVVTGGAAAVAVTLDGAALEGVSVQGGEVGVEARGEVALAAVRWSAQRAAALRAGPGARVKGARLEVVGTLPGVDGLVAEDAVLEVRGARFSGGLRRAVAVRGGSLDLEDAAAEGPATLVHAVEARATVRGASATGGQGPAVFRRRRPAPGGAPDGGGPRVRGAGGPGRGGAGGGDRPWAPAGGGGAAPDHRPGAGPHRGAGRRRGWGAARRGQHHPGGGHRPRRRRLGRPGPPRQRRAGPAGGGVHPRRGRCRAGVLGDGLLVRDAQVDGGVVEVQDVEGSGLTASAQARVRLRALTLRRSGGPGVLVERGASVELERLEVHGAWGPALVASEGGQARVGVLVAPAAQELVWADCEAGAGVVLGAVEGAAAPAPSRCVRVGPSPPR